MTVAFPGHFTVNERKTAGEGDKTDLGKSTHLYDETQALSTENCLDQVQEEDI